MSIARSSTWNYHSQLGGQYNNKRTTTMVIALAIAGTFFGMLSFGILVGAIALGGAAGAFFGGMLTVASSVFLTGACVVQAVRRLQYTLKPSSAPDKSAATVDPSLVG